DERPKDRLLGGLLSPEFDEASCLSRDQSAQYWKQSNHTPSPYLLQKLRNYESLHRRCGPNTELYNKSIEQLKSNASTRPSECNYVVWLESGGIGNRVISMVSTFLYALLNDKVFLLKLPDDFHGIFCEPFPGTSWILYSDFPIQDLDGFDISHPQIYGNIRKNNLLRNDMDAAKHSLPPYLYLYLIHDYSGFDKMFYCEEGQRLLRRFAWLFLKSNRYYVPAFFLNSEYSEELSLLFPEKATVFLYLSRYLLHPTNSVWGHITRYYESYVANAKQWIGIQVRMFGFAPFPFERMVSQIINCSLTGNILPEIVEEESAAPTTITGAKPRSVLVTSLRSGYFEKLRSMYYEHATTTGEVISVHQPSHEEEQHSEKLNHNMKAFAEIYLLSLSDALITSPFSTFGYVAQGLGGLRPWLLVRPDDHDLCLHSTSMEPCFHFPPSYDCKARKKVDIGSVAPYLRHCEDFPHGVRLFD
ncbi:Xyloglucan fucosyltransferase, partial [Musa troglodytarum]